MPKTRNEDNPGGLIDELRAGLKIDKNSLDDHLMEQPDAYWRVSEAYVMACSRRDEIKLDRDQAIAGLDKQLRSEAEKAGAKTTEKSLQSEIDTAPKILDFRKHYARASEQADMLAAMKEAYRDRSGALRELAQLYASNYFTVSTGSRARREVTDDAAIKIRIEGGQKREQRART